MKNNAARLLVICITLTLGVLANACFGKSNEWMDASTHASFEGTPGELIEPYALFRVNGIGRLVPLSVLNREDSFRFYQEVKDRPSPSQSWVDANAKLTTEVVGKLTLPRGDQFVPFDFRLHHEPTIIIGVYVDQNDERQRQMVAAAIAPYRKLKKAFGDKVEAIFIGVNQNAVDHASISRVMNMPWPLTDMYKQSECRILTRHTPDAGFGIIIFSRDGDPLFSELLPTSDVVAKLFDNLYGLMDVMRPENIKGWPARVHFWGAVQIKKYETGRSEPLLVGNPLLPEGLIQRGIFHLEAEIPVAADGQVGQVKIAAQETLAPKLVAALSGALGKAVLVPAVENGRFVDSIYHYHFQAEKSP